MASAWGAAFGSAWGNSWGGVGQQVLPASLGGSVQRHDARRNTRDEDTPEEPMQPVDVARIRNEFLSESLAQDLMQRARVRTTRAEEEALLMMI